MKDLGFLKRIFSVIFLTETWADETAKNNLLFRIPNYIALQQTSNGQRDFLRVLMFLRALRAFIFYVLCVLSYFYMPYEPLSFYAPSFFYVPYVPSFYNKP